MKPVYLIHGIGVEVPPLAMKHRDARDTLIAPPAALCYRTSTADASNTVVVSALGGVVVVQAVGRAATREAARAYYVDDTHFDPWYRRALEVAGGVIGEEPSDFSFSFLWWETDTRGAVGWELVEMPMADRPLLIETTLIWCLADVVDAAIKRLPLVRAKGDVPREFVSQALDLFSLEDPSQTWVNKQEIAAAQALYDAWRLGERISQLRARFDQAASGFSFYWEASERQRETTLTIALAVVAVVGLLQADSQLQRILGFSLEAIDLAILALALALSLWTLWRALLSRRIAERRRAATWEHLRRRLIEPRQ